MLFLCDLPIFTFRPKKALTGFQSHDILLAPQERNNLLAGRLSLGLHKTTASSGNSMANHQRIPHRRSFAFLLMVSRHNSPADTPHFPQHFPRIPQHLIPALPQHFPSTFLRIPQHLIPALPWHFPPHFPSTTPASYPGIFPAHPSTFPRIFPASYPRIFPASYPRIPPHFPRHYPSTTPAPYPGKTPSPLLSRITMCQQVWAARTSQRITGVRMVRAGEGLQWSFSLVQHSAEREVPNDVRY